MSGTQTEKSDILFLFFFIAPYFCQQLSFQLTWTKVPCVGIVVTMDPLSSSVCLLFKFQSFSHKPHGNKLGRNVILSRAPEFTPGFQWGSYCSIFSLLCSVQYIIVIPPFPEGGEGYTVLPLSVCPSVQAIFRRIFLSKR